MKEKQIEEKRDLKEILYMSGYGLLRGDCNDIAGQIQEQGYRKSTDVAREIFEEIGKILRRFDEIAERDKSEYGELIVGDITASIAELKKKYTEERE